MDKNEKSILKSFEDDEWESVPSDEDLEAKYQDYAKATLTKDKRINIRLPSKVLNDLQKHAMEEGLPYQTLISSILYKYVTGRLVDKKK